VTLDAMLEVIIAETPLFSASYIAGKIGCCPDLAARLCRRHHRLGRLTAHKHPSGRITYAKDKSWKIMNKGD
jgi:hypothetical protein